MCFRVYVHAAYHVFESENYDSNAFMRFAVESSILTAEKKKTRIKNPERDNNANEWKRSEANESSNSKIIEIQVTV